MEHYNADRALSFIKSFYKDDEGDLEELYRNSIDAGVPVIRTDTRQYIKTQILIKKPMRILEIGTAVGYSSLYMSNFLPDGGKITTIELDCERYKIACDNINRFGKKDIINAIQGDALEVIKGLPETHYDMVFVDAAKGQYINYLQDIVRVIKDEGIIISDNVLCDGEILESHFVVEKRNRTIHDRMRDYLYRLTHDRGFTTSIILVGDGLAITHVSKGGAE